MTLSKRISETETMMDGDLDRYLAVGADAMAAITHVLGSDRPRAILDLPCGHGRVARHLRFSYPEAALFVADLDYAGADFCAAEFDATRLPADTHFQSLDYGRTFDLIWVGSLVTHLDAEATRNFLVFCARHLSANGVAIVTTHGPFVAGRLFLSDRSLYGLVPDIEEFILARYMQSGYGYHDYPYQSGYGISLTSRDWMARAAQAAGLRIDSHRDHAWDNHQDVVALRRALRPVDSSAP